jgi:uncharacterized repeat protein (TIGR01451 family)
MHRFRRALCAVPIAVAVAVFAGPAAAALDVSAAALAPPVASDDVLTTPQNTPGIVFPSFSDPDGDEVAITSATPTAEHGTVSCDEVSCTYTPDLDYLGPDSFEYTVSDGTETASGTITVEVVEPTANLSLAKDDGPDPVTVGEELTYTLTVHNGGPAPAEDVSVADTLPAGVTFGTASASQGTCTETLGAVTCDLGSLASGADATVTITVTPTATGTLQNTASVTSTTPDPLGEDNFSFTNTDVEAPATATLIVIKQVTNDGGGEAAPGDFTLHVESGGVDVAGSPQAGSQAGTAYSLAPGDYTVSEEASAGYEGVFGGDCDDGGRVTLAAAETKTCTVTNDDVAVGANLALAKDDSPDPVTVGEELTYSLTVHNAGPGTADDVAVSDTLPTGVTFGAASASQGTCAELDGVVTCDLGQLASGADATVTITVTPTATGTLQNTASVTSTTPDPLGEDNFSSATTDVQAPAPTTGTLTVIKQVTNDDGGAATPADFTLDVTGNAPSPASFAGAGAPGTAVTLGAGAYTVSEEDAPGYTVSYSDECTGTIAPGESLTCTVTNDDTPSAPAADLQIEKAVSDPTPALGQHFTYRLTVTNAGPETADDVVVTDELASSLHLNRARRCAARPAAGGGTHVECALGELAAGAVRTIRLRVEARFFCDFIGTPVDDDDRAIGSTIGADVICGGGGDDRFSGGGGDDSLYGLADPQTLAALPADVANTVEATSTTLDAEPADNSASTSVTVTRGVDGRDRIFGNEGDDTLDGGVGRDDLRGGPGEDSLAGGAGADRLAGNGGDDTLDGGPGRDDMSGGSGDDTMDGGPGNDVMNGNSGDDTMEGGPGDDFVNGGSGEDTLSGNDGQDRLRGSSGNDTLDGGNGSDVLRGGSLVAGPAGALVQWLFCGPGIDRYSLGPPGEAYDACELVLVLPG